eukprot:IDg15265t1
MGNEAHACVRDIVQVRTTEEISEDINDATCAALYKIFAFPFSRACCRIMDPGARPSAP